MKNILLCVNSDIGRGNTIGFRFGKIAAELRKKGIKFEIMGRANYDSQLSVVTPFYKNYLARFFNAVRIYLLPFLNFRSLDVYLFDRFVHKRLKKNHNFEAVHFGEYLPKSTALAKQLGLKVFLDIPIGYQHYSYFLPGGEEKITRRPSYVKEAISQADLLIAPSEFVRHSLKLANFSKPVEVIPFGADHPQNFSLSDIKKKAEAKELVFLFAGNINYRKGANILLDSWNKLELTDAKLIMCGRVFKEIRKSINLHKCKNVEFTGFVDLKKYWRQAHVFVFPTLLEGSAKAVYEAMSYGLPVITTFNAGSTVVDGESGFIVPVADSNKLEEKIKFFHKHREEIVRFGTQAFKTAAKYTWEDYAAKVAAAYEKHTN